MRLSAEFFKKLRLKFPRKSQASSTETAQDKKTGSKSNIKILTIGIAVLVISSLGTYFYLTTFKKGAAIKDGKMLVNTATASQTLPGPVTSPVPLPTPQTQTQQENKDIKLAEENPFKAEFLKRFEKKTVAHLPPPEGFIIDKKIDTQRFNQIPVAPVASEIPVQTPQQNSLKTPPVINVFGVYKVRDKIVALTDKGELQVGSVINEDYRVAHISMSGKVDIVGKE